MLLRTAAPGIVRIQVVALPSLGDWTDSGDIAVPEVGEWDQRFDSVQPIGVTEIGGSVIIYYIGADGDRADGGPAHRKLGALVSTDGGATWAKHAGNPIVSHNPQAVPANEDEEGIFSGGVTVKGNTVHLVYGGLTSVGTSTVRCDSYHSTSTDGLAFTPNAEPGNKIIDADDASFAGQAAGGDDESPPYGLFYDSVGDRFYLPYHARETAAVENLQLAEGADLDNLDGAESSTIITGGIDADDEWRSAHYIDRGTDDQGNRNIDLFVSRLERPGVATQEIYRFPVIGGDFSNLGSPVLFYDFDPEMFDIAVFFGMHLSRSLGKWFLAYEFRDAGGNKSIRVKTAPIEFEGG